MIRTLIPALACIAVCAAPTSAFAQDVEAAVMSFEADLIDYRRESRVLSARAQKTMAAAEHASVDDEDALWVEAASDLRSVFALTLKLRGSFLNLAAVMDEQPPFFYPEIRKKLANTSALVEGAVQFGVVSVVRVELRRAGRTSETAAVAQAFLAQHLHILTPEDLIEPQAAIQEFVRQRREVAYQARRIKIDGRNEASRLGKKRDLHAWERAIGRLEATQNGFGDDDVATERFAKALRGRALLRVDLVPELSAGLGLGVGMGVQARVMAGRFHVGGGVGAHHREGLFSPVAEGRIGVDLLAHPPWQQRRSALLPTISYTSMGALGVGFEFSRMTRRPTQKHIGHIGLGVDFMPREPSVRIRLMFGAGAPL